MSRRKAFNDFVFLHILPVCGIAGLFALAVLRFYQHEYAMAGASFGISLLLALSYYLLQLRSIFYVFSITGPWCERMNEHKNGLFAYHNRAEGHWELTSLELNPEELACFADLLKELAEQKMTQAQEEANINYTQTILKQ